MSDDRFARLKSLSGDYFWLELTPITLGLLARAARLQAADLAVLIHRSQSHTAKLLRGEGEFVDDVCTTLSFQFCFHKLAAQVPNARPLVQLTPRSLLLLRKGRGLSQVTLGGQVGLSDRYIRAMESKPSEPPAATRQALSEALGVQLFLL